jgi:hypothetical protein
MTAQVSSDDAAGGRERGAVQAPRGNGKRSNRLVQRAVGAGRGQQ